MLGTLTHAFSQVSSAVRAWVAPSRRAALAQLALIAVLVGCPSSSAPLARGGGPVADYDRIAGVALHRDTDDMAPELRPTLQRLIGRRLVVTSWTALSRDPDDAPGELDGSLRWLRDYQPIYVRDAAGTLFAVRYLSENPNRSAFRTPHRGGARSGVRRKGHDWMPTPEGGQWVATRTLPLLHENGNLLVVGRRVIVSEKLIADNAIERTEPHLVRAGYRARSRSQVIRLLAKTLLRSEEDILVVPPLPYEATEHVDVFLLPLDERTVMVPGIEERALALTPPAAREVGEDVRDFLEDVATTLEEEGLRVRRWPMIPPAVALSTPDGHGVTAEEADEQDIEADLELLVFSPANALLLNLEDNRVAVLPSFHAAFEDPKTVALSRQYTARWRRELRDRGFETALVDATDLVGYLGLIRCVTAPIPEP